MDCPRDETERLKGLDDKFGKYSETSLKSLVRIEKEGVVCLLLGEIISQRVLKKSIFIRFSYDIDAWSCIPACKLKKPFMHGRK